MSLMHHNAYDVQLEKLLQGQEELQHAIAVVNTSVHDIVRMLQAPAPQAIAELRSMAASEEQPHKIEQQATGPNLSPTVTGTSLQRGHSFPVSERCSNGAGALLPRHCTFKRDSLFEVAQYPHIEAHVELMRHNLEEIAKDWGLGDQGLVADSHIRSIMSSPWVSTKNGPRLPFHPLALIPTVFDCMSAIVLMMDALMIPVMVAWDVPADGWLAYLAIFMIAFWSCDIVLKFCTGFIKGASVILSWNAVIKRYLQKSFAFDLLLVLFDCIDILIVRITSSGHSGPWKVVRLLRFAKLTRMIRICTRLSSSMGVVRVGSLLSAWAVRSFGAYSSILHYINLAGILLKLAFAIMGFSHLLACAWYFLLQNFTPSDADSWLTAIPSTDDKEIYLYGVYLSLSTMIAGGSFLSPVLLWEVVYATVLILVGALFVTSITSTLAATLIEAQLAWVERNQKLAGLTGFLEQEDMPGLVLMIVHEDFVTNTSASKSNMTEANVSEQMSVLSKDVRNMLRDLQYSTSFRRIAIFRLVNSLDFRIVQDLCTGASFHLFAPASEVFDVDQDMINMILLSKGRAQYRLRGTAQHRGNSRSIQADTWLCEGALLFIWRTFGSMEAEVVCETLSVSVDAFAKAISRLPGALSLVSSFCEQAFKVIQDVSSNVAVSDVNLGFDPDLIATHMPTLVRHLLVSAPLLQNHRQQTSGLTGLFRGSSLPALEQEIAQGQCHLATMESGDTIRVVKMVLLSLVDEHGRVCVQLAEGLSGAGSDLEAKVGLPGKKAQGDQSPQWMIQNMLESHFAELRDAIELIGLDEEPIIEYGRSKSYGILTKYIKFIMRANLHGSVMVRQHAISTTSSKARIWSSRKPSQLLVAAFAITSNDQRCIIMRWTDEADYDLGSKNRDAENQAVKAWLSQVSHQHFEDLKQWRLVQGEYNSSEIAEPLEEVKEEPLEEALPPSWQDEVEKSSAMLECTPRGLPKISYEAV